jgi:hypothetical protein
MAENYSTSIKYYRLNANNTTIATSQTGSGAPTEEIATPAVHGTFASMTGATIVNGQTGSSFNNFNAGQYLYRIDGTGAYLLMGQIASIQSGIQLTLTSAAQNTGSAVAGQSLAAGFNLITTQESFYIRIAVNKYPAGGNGPNTATMPDISYWRTSASNTADNKTNITKLEQVSAGGNPISWASSATNVAFSLQVMNQIVVFTDPGDDYIVFAEFKDIPEFVWLKATLSKSNPAFAGQTMYRITTEEAIPGIIVSLNYFSYNLFQAGYLDLTV